MEGKSVMRLGGPTTQQGEKLSPISLRYTPIWLCLLIVALTALVYLSQVNRVSAANARLQEQHSISQQLQQQHQQALAELAHVQSPEYVMERARSLGLHPTLWEDRP
jgi:Septum formation initiator